MEKEKQQDWKINFLHFLKENFSKKNNLMRLIIFAIAFVAVVPASIALNIWAQHAPSPNYGNNGFIVIVITTNSGISFESLSDHTALVYFVQIFTTLIILGVILFSKTWYITLFWSFAFLGGFFNICDRATPKFIESMHDGIVHKDVVIDYFKFAFTEKFAIFNLPDSFVCVGVIGGVIAYITKSLINLRNRDDKDKEQKK